MFSTNIGKYNSYNIDNIKNYVIESYYLGVEYIKINIKKKNNLKKKFNNKEIETRYGLINIDEYEKQYILDENKISYISKLCKKYEIKLYTVVDDIESIDLMSKYTDICEIEKTTLNYKLYNYAKTKFSKIIISVVEPDLEEVTDIFYSYNPYIILINTKRNIKILKKIKNKIGSIKLGYTNSNTKYYLGALINGAEFFVKDCSYLFNKNYKLNYSKLIDNIKDYKNNLIY